jgi:ubiquitin carboxyl-terminal hydrolase L3
VFTTLIHKLGVSSALEFMDIYSIDDPELLAFVPRPVFALVLVFPTSKNYECRVKQEESGRGPYQGKGGDEEVIWFRQTINNARGLYGILHAVSNGDAKDFIGM